jgi:hypothetical protein
MVWPKFAAVWWGDNPAPRAAFDGKFNIDKLGQLMNILIDLDFVIGAAARDKQTGIFTASAAHLIVRLPRPSG